MFLVLHLFAFLIRVLLLKVKHLSAFSAFPSWIVCQPHSQASEQNSDNIERTQTRTVQKLFVQHEDEEAYISNLFN